jgi:hypothetical protein
MQYKTCVGGSFTQEDHKVEEMGLFDDVGIIMDVKIVLKACAKIVKRLDEGGIIDYIKFVQLNEEGIKILSKYYIQIGGLHYSYGGYSSHENNFVNLNFIVCMIALTKDAKA